MENNSIPADIIKIQKKLAGFEKGSRNYHKYTKILAKHVKKHSMKKRVISHIKTIENVQKLSLESSKKENTEN